MNLVGIKFGRLTVAALTDKKPGSWWGCLCECGQTATRSTRELNAGRRHGCSRCLLSDRANRNRQMAALRRSKYPLLLRKVYDSMKRRCYCENDEFFQYYGGRGITVSNEWLNNPSAFYEWALKSGYRKGLTVDRINTDGNYSPENCRWVDRATQSRNRRSCHQIAWNGKVQTIAEWAVELGVKKQSLWHRYNAGWSIERMLTEPFK